MLRQLISGTMLTAIAILPAFHSASAASLSPDQSISIQFNNGSAPTRDGQPLANFGDSFSLQPGESFTIGGGSSFFSFTDFPEGVETVQLSLQVNPGDSFLNLNLPGGFNLTADQPISINAEVSEGEALSIAYGYDAAQDTFAYTQFQLLGSDIEISPRSIEVDEPVSTAVPEPTVPLAMGVVAIAGLSHARRRHQ